MTYDFSILRVLRKKKGVTIGELSRQSGVSYVALSKLERNQGNPELRTLDRISRALGLATCNFLALAERKHPVQTKEEVRTILDTVTCRFVNLDGTRILYLKAPKGAHGTEPDFLRDDYEFCYVLEGRMKITIRGSDYEVKAGESLVWDCFFDHNFEAMENTDMIIVLVPKRP
jgi:transcriptional regulator with XRE-family HTH domain